MVTTLADRRHTQCDRSGCRAAACATHGNHLKCIETIHDCIGDGSAITGHGAFGPEDAVHEGLIADGELRVNIIRGLSPGQDTASSMP